MEFMKALALTLAGNGPYLNEVSFNIMIQENISFRKENSISPAQVRAKKLGSL